MTKKERNRRATRLAYRRAWVALEEARASWSDHVNGCKTYNVSIDDTPNEELAEMEALVGRYLQCLADRMFDRLRKLETNTAMTSADNVIFERTG